MACVSLGDSSPESTTMRYTVCIAAIFSIASMWWHLSLLRQPCNIVHPYVPVHASGSQNAGPASRTIRVAQSNLGGSVVTLEFKDKVCRQIPMGPIRGRRNDADGPNLPPKLKKLGQ